MNKLLVITIIYWSSFGVSTAAANRVWVNGILATVNNEVITESGRQAFAQRIQNDTMIDELLLLEIPTAQLKIDAQTQIEYLIREKLLESEIKRLNLTVTVERVEQELREIARRNGISRKDLPKVLTEQGLKMSDYQDFLKSRIERMQLIEQEISNRIRVSDEEVVTELVRRVPGAEQSMKTAEYLLDRLTFQTRDQAQVAKDRLAKGEVFRSLIDEAALPGRINNESGSLGLLRESDLNPALRKIISPLAVGETSEIIQTGTRWQLLNLREKKISVDPRFNQAKEQIRAELTDKAFKRQMSVWLEQVRAESIVSIKKR